MTDDDFKRLETKVDKLTDAVSKLILVEERLANQGERIGRVERAVAVVETNVSKLDRTVSTWINRGIGAWALLLLIWSVGQKLL
jgi:hypothetical protein